jgi:hypothetical protein
MRVRAGCAVGAGVGGRGARADFNKRGCVCCPQGGGDGGVVRMSDGNVTFKGGTISDTTAVRARPLRSHVACCVLQRPLLSVAWLRTTMRAT